MKLVAAGAAHDHACACSLSESLITGTSADECGKKDACKKQCGIQAQTSGDQAASEAQGPNMQRFVQQLSGKVRLITFRCGDQCSPHAGT